MTDRRKLASLLGVHSDITKCRECMHAEAGHSTAIPYCRIGPPPAFCHQMRQPGAPCGPSAFQFKPKEAGK